MQKILKNNNMIVAKKQESDTDENEQIIAF
jgi:hypothetical protein